MRALLTRGVGTCVGRADEHAVGSNRDGTGSGGLDDSEIGRPASDLCQVQVNRLVSKEKRLFECADTHVGAPVVAAAADEVVVVRLANDISADTVGEAETDAFVAALVQLVGAGVVVESDNIPEEASTMRTHRAPGRPTQSWWSRGS